MSPTIKKVLITMGIVIVLVSALVGLVFTFTAAPVKVADSLVRDIAASKMEEAYALTTQAFQDSKELRGVPDFLAQHEDFSTITDITFSSRSITNDTAELKGRIKTSTASYDLNVKLINQSSGWKVYSIDIVPF